MAVLSIILQILGGMALAGIGFLLLLFGNEVVGGWRERRRNQADSQRQADEAKTAQLVQPPAPYTRLQEPPYLPEEVAWIVEDITQVYEWLRGYQTRSHEENLFLLQQDEAVQAEQSDPVDGQGE